MKGLVITTAVIAFSVATLMSQSAAAGDDSPKPNTAIAADHSWTCDYHFDPSTNLWN